MTAFWKRLVRTIEIPFDPLHEESNRANVISALINLFVLVLVLYAIPVILTRGFYSYQILLILLTLITMTVFRLMVQKGHVRLVSMLLAATIWLFINTVFLFFENGMRSPTYLAGLAFVIVYVGLLHNERAVLLVTALSILTGVMVWILELNGILLTTPRMPDVRWAIIALFFLLPIIAFIISRSLRNYRSSIALYRAEAEMRTQSEQQVRTLNQDLEEAYSTTLEGWARALELRDKETEGHSRRVIQLTIDISREMGISEEEIKYIAYGAMLHDIGKMGIPDAILKKPGKLTEEEWQVIKQHPVLAYDLLKGIKYLQPALSIPYLHHENWDGSGYPLGLTGDDIPLPARIFRVVDNWDALTTDRPYRSAWSLEQVKSYLRENCGSIFDRQVVDIFLQHIVCASQ